MYVDDVENLHLGYSSRLRLDVRISYDGDVMIFGGVCECALICESLRRSYSTLRGGFRLRCGRGRARGGSDIPRCCKWSGNWSVAYQQICNFIIPPGISAWWDGSRIHTFCVPMPPMWLILVMLWPIVCDTSAKLPMTLLRIFWEHLPCFSNRTMSSDLELSRSCDRWSFLSQSCWL